MAAGSEHPNRTPPSLGYHHSAVMLGMAESAGLQFRIAEAEMELRSAALDPRHGVWIGRPALLGGLRPLGQQGTSARARSR